MIIPIFVISLASSVLTEILKLFPKLTATPARKRILAFAVALIASGVYIISKGEQNTGEILELIGGALGGTFIIYKALVQPVVNIVIDPVKKKLAEPKTPTPIV